MSKAEKECATTMFENRKEFKGAVIGMVLGDGSLWKTKGARENSYFYTAHCERQKPYAHYKADILGWLTRVSVKDYPAKHPVKENVILLNTEIRTMRHPMYTKLRNRFYYQNRKTVTDHLMKMLTPMGLALWYQDDGCFAYHGGCQEVYLNTQCFNLAEHELMSRHLQKRFGIQIRTNRAQSKYYCLRLRRKDRQKFIDIVSPFIHKSMNYKINITDNWEDTPGRPLHDKMTVTCALCGKTYKRHYKKGGAHKFCGECYFTRRNECIAISNNNGVGSDIQSQDIVCSA